MLHENANLQPLPASSHLCGQGVDQPVTALWLSAIHRAMSLTGAFWSLGHVSFAQLPAPTLQRAGCALASALASAADSCSLTRIEQTPSFTAANTNALPFTFHVVDSSEVPAQATPSSAPGNLDALCFTALATSPLGLTLLQRWRAGSRRSGPRRASCRSRE